ncbi:MAG: hypothetical protein GY809_20170 [Planctomycetes bacterium]|nr:hypothetical protein [Planctomycetota bacterium]
MKKIVVILMMPMIVTGAVANAAEPTLPSREEVQRHWASIGKFKNPALQHWREVSGPGTGVWNNLHRRQLEAQSILDLSEDELTALMPDQTPLIHQPCPVCARKTPENTQVTALTRFWRNYNFDPFKPGEIQCGECNTVFPNEQFAPEKAKFDTFVNLEGKKITVPYWEYDCLWSGKPPTRKGRFYMMGVIDSARKAWVMPRFSALAECYWLTLDETYARCLIRVLELYAARYPHWLLTNGEGHYYEGAEKELKGGMPGWTSTRWPRRLMEDCPADLMNLFDLVASSPSMNEQVRQRIVKDLFLNPLKRHEPIYKDARKDAIYGNTSHLGGIINHASILLDPGMMHDCCKWLREMPHYASSSDGVHIQSLTYGRLFHHTFFNHVRRLEGYSDPTGFTTEDGSRIDNFHVLPAMEDYFRRLSSAHRALRLPSGGSVTYDDGGPEWGTTQWWPYEGSWKPLQRSRNVLLPGTRRAILGYGEGDRQIQVHLDFAEHGVNHGHGSGLSMQIYAFGHYLVDDISYDKSILRRYSEMSISHPTVTIDHQNQVRSDTRGDVDFYAPLMDGVSAIRVNNERVYPGLASQYTRTLVLNSIDLDAPYVIDLFEVEGGTLHDYRLRSSSQHPSTACASIVTNAMPGLRPLLPEGENWREPPKQRASVGSGYGVFFDVERAKVKKPFHVTVSVENPWEAREGLEPAYKAAPDSWVDKPPIGIRHHVALGHGYEFFSAQSPSLKEAGFYGIKGAKTEEWPRIPHQLLRHRVKSGERSVFVVVHEPCYSAPKIGSVTRLETGDDKLVALSIEMQDRTDTFLYALDGEREMDVQGNSANGRLALVSKSNGKAPRGYLVQGGKLKTDDIDLERKDAAYSGPIVRAERHWGNKAENRFLVKSTSAIPDGDVLRGHWMTIYPGDHPENRRRCGFTGDKATKLFTELGNDVMVAHTQPGAKRLPGVVKAAEIERVENTPKGTWIYVTQDHGLDQRDDGGLTEFYFPGFAYEGNPTFRIATVASTHPVALPDRAQPLVITPSRTQDGELDLKPGIRISKFAWSTEQLATGVDHRSAETLPAEALDKEDATSSEIVNAINEIELKKRLRTLPKPGTLRLQGYLTVPKDGVYTFYFGGSDESRMTLNGMLVIENFWGRAEMPDEQQVRLKAGNYAVTLDCFRQTKRSIWFTADWEGPDMTRRSFLPNINIIRMEPHTEWSQITFELEEMKDKGLAGAAYWDTRLPIHSPAPMVCRNITKTLPCWRSLFKRFKA